MHGSQTLAVAVAEASLKAAAGLSEAPGIVLCSPFTLLYPLKDLIKNSPLQLGAQDCATETQGAYTGEISAQMLREVGVSHVILGHSERRQYFGETDEIVRKKCETALSAGLNVILCVGETLAEYEKKQTAAVVKKQLENAVPRQANTSNLMIAYEPIWAIGTGKVPSNADIEDTHALIKQQLPGFTVLYGGSVKAQNAAEIMGLKDVGGVLVGGASIEPQSFAEIIRAGS